MVRINYTKVEQVARILHSLHLEIEESRKVGFGGYSFIGQRDSETRIPRWSVYILPDDTAAVLGYSFEYTVNGGDAIAVETLATLEHDLKRFQSKKTRRRGYHRTGTLEVFHHPTHYDLNLSLAEDEDLYEPGYYWWSCLPGCLPDSEAIGPFVSLVEAKIDATSY